MTDDIKLDERGRALRDFFGADGRLKSIPAKRKKRAYILERLVSEFEPGRVYEEKEVNAVLRRFHDDFCTLRREFIINKLMVRERGRYRRCSSTPRSEAS
ncbi:MAG: DUF2087 domain-containing protein [Elusimicrobiota bacterium]